MADNIILGSGRFHVALDGDGGRERYLGDTLSGALTPNRTNLVIPASDGADVNRKLADVTTELTYVLNVVMKSMSMENIQLFMQGALSDADVTAVVDEVAALGNVLDEAAALKAAIAASTVGSVADVLRLIDESDVGPGTAVYRLGSARVAGGVRAVEAAGLTAKVDDSGAGAVAAAAIVDAEADGRTLAELRAAAVKVLAFPSRGLLAVVDKTVFGADQSAQEKGKFRISYTPAAGKRVATGSKATLNGAVRYREDSLIGQGRHLYLTRAVLAPNGEWGLKSRSEEQRLPLTCTSEGAVYVDGAAA